MHQSVLCFIPNLFLLVHDIYYSYNKRGNLFLFRSQPFHLNVSASDGAGYRALQDAEVFLSVTDSTMRPPLFERTRYSFNVREDVPRNSIVGAVKATFSDGGKLGCHDCLISKIFVTNFINTRHALLLMFSKILAK